MDREQVELLAHPLQRPGINIDDDDLVLLLNQDARYVKPDFARTYDDDSHLRGLTRYASRCFARAILDV